MANIRNFGLVGVGPDVQLGKAGPRLATVDSGGTVAIEARSANGSIFVPLRAAPATLATEVVVKAQLDLAISNTVSRDGFDIRLGGVVAKGDGAWTPGAVPLSDTTSVSEAVDRLNETLSLLIPPQPPQLTATPLTVASVGAAPLLASGAVPNNLGTAPPTSAGSAVTRITAASVTSNVFSDVGPGGINGGDAGTISLVLNGATVGSRTMLFGSANSDNGNYSGLVISDDKAFPPATPGFWESVDVTVNRAVDAGWNRIRLGHSQNTPALTNEVFFVRDTVTAVPAISGLTFSQAAAGTQAFSSSVPHYGTGGQLTVGLSYSNLSGEVYYGGAAPVTISATNSAFSTQTFGYAALGIATPVARQTTAPTAISPVTVAVNGAIFGAGQLQAVARNVNGNSTTAVASGTILVFNNATQGVNENNIAVNTLGTGSGNAVRVGGLANSATPSIATVDTWASSAALADHEAAVVAGVLSRNVTDYSTGFFPAGPNLNTGGRAIQQYFTVRFARSAVSQFRIAVTGSYSGCWIALPGVTTNASISPNALGGAWWNMFAPYDGAGVPGEAGDAAAGCASGTTMTGASGTFTAVFGPQSSSNAISNFIYVRFRLNAGQSITALSFSN